MSEQLSIFDDSEQPTETTTALEIDTAAIAATGERRSKFYDPNGRPASDAAEDQGWGEINLPQRTFTRKPLPPPSKPYPTVRHFGDPDLQPTPEERGEGRVELPPEQIAINNTGLDEAKAALKRVLDK